MFNCLLSSNEKYILGRKNNLAFPICRVNLYSSYPAYLTTLPLTLSRLSSEMWTFFNEMKRNLFLGSSLYCPQSAGKQIRKKGELLAMLPAASHFNLMTAYITTSQPDIRFSIWKNAQPSFMQYCSTINFYILSCTHLYHTSLR